MCTIGTRIRGGSSPYLKMITQYREPGSNWVNFMSCPWSLLKGETLWVFPPRKLSNLAGNKVLRKRNFKITTLFCLIQHVALPPLFPLFCKYCSEYRTYTGSWLLERSQAKAQSFILIKKTSIVQIFRFN